jgi:hypothetical protein
MGAFGEQLLPAVESLKLVLRMASSLGFDKVITLQPLKLHQHPFKDGVTFEVAWGPRKADILAAGGRYGIRLL